MRVPKVFALDIARSSKASSYHARNRPVGSELARISSARITECHWPRTSENPRHLQVAATSEASVIDIDGTLAINRAAWNHVAPRFHGGTALPEYGPLAPTEDDLRLLNLEPDLRVLELGCGSG